MIPILFVFSAEASASLIKDWAPDLVRKVAKWQKSLAKKRDIRRTKSKARSGSDEKSDSASVSSLTLASEKSLESAVEARVMEKVKSLFSSAEGPLKDLVTGIFTAANVSFPAPSDMGLPPSSRPGSPRDTVAHCSPVSGGEGVPHVLSPLSSPTVTAKGFEGKGGHELEGSGLVGVLGSQLAAGARGSGDVRPTSSSVLSRRGSVAQDLDARVQSWVEASAALTCGAAVAEVHAEPPVVGDPSEVPPLSCSVGVSSRRPSCTSRKVPSEPPMRPKVFPSPKSHASAYPDPFPSPSRPSPPPGFPSSPVPPSHASSRIASLSVASLCPSCVQSTVASLAYSLTSPSISQSMIPSIIDSVTSAAPCPVTTSILLPAYPPVVPVSASQSVTRVSLPQTSVNSPPCTLLSDSSTSPFSGFLPPATPPPVHPSPCNSHVPSSPAPSSVLSNTSSPLPSSFGLLPSSPGVAPVSPSLKNPLLSFTPSTQSLTLPQPVIPAPPVAIPGRSLIPQTYLPSSAVVVPPSLGQPSQHFVYQHPSLIPPPPLQSLFRPSS